MTQKNYYQTLGLQSSASEQEIRRAYRILARRYHPDVNPGADSSERFQAIAEAYEHLSDREKRKQHDLSLHQSRYRREKNRATASPHQSSPRGHRAYAEEMRKKFQAQSSSQRPSSQQRTNPHRKSPSSQGGPHHGGKRSSWRTALEQAVKTPLPELLQSARNRVFGSSHQGQPKAREGERPQERSVPEAHVQSVSLVEVSLSVFEAIAGTKKTLEIPTGETTRKISVKIPAGVITGSTVRMRSKKLRGQELVCIILVAAHPFLELNKNGLVVDLPVTVSEAYHGATVQVPTLTEPILLKVPPRSATGFLIPLKNQGPVMRSGIRGDLLYRVLVQAPTDGIAPQYESLLKELDGAYSRSVRSELPQALTEGNH